MLGTRLGCFEYLEMVFKHVERQTAVAVVKEQMAHLVWAEAQL